jgi:hypothetical protein
MAAAFAVVASLALVAYELKQTREIGMAEIYLQSAAMAMEYQAVYLTTERLRTAIQKGWEEPAQLTRKEISLIVDFAEGLMYHQEAHFYQHRLGMTDDVEWALTKKPSRNLVN